MFSVCSLLHTDTVAADRGRYVIRTPATVKPPYTITFYNSPIPLFLKKNQPPYNMKLNTNTKSLFTLHQKSCCTEVWLDLDYQYLTCPAKSDGFPFCFKPYKIQWKLVVYHPTPARNSIIDRKTCNRRTLLACQVSSAPGIIFKQIDEESITHSLVVEIALF